MKEQFIDKPIKVAYDFNKLSRRKKAVDIVI